jgi:ubiquinone/menaquinone biosynthesis C-methylase UbiE
MLFVNRIIYLFKGFAWFKRLNAKVTYEVLAKYIPAEDWHFMNYGYEPSSEERMGARATEVKSQQYSANMYHYLGCKQQIADKNILEVGSGRGGGARYISQHFKPSSYIGIDIAQNAVDLANKIHQVPNLKFIQGSAESIPLKDSSIDVVLNVESCHGYGDVPKFLSEVKRVLKPGGYLLLVDFRNSIQNMEIFKHHLNDSKMELISEENISSKVVSAIEAENESKCEKIATLIPAKFQKLFGDFAGVVGSRFHTTLKDGTRPYYRFVLRKPS